MTTNEIIAANCAPLTPVERDVLGTAMDGAREIFVMQGKVSAVLLACIGVKFHMIPLVGATKGQASATMHRLAEQGPCAFIAEAWITHMTAAKNPELVKAIQAGDLESAVIIEPRNAPDRLEGVTVLWRHQARTIMAEALIARPAKGAPTLGDWRIEDSKKSDGTFHAVGFGPESEAGMLT